MKTTPANEPFPRAAERLPLGVVIPTFNSSAYLPAHLASLDRWLDLAREVVVVDSESTDGTVELLRAGLIHPNLRFFTRPRGLYQAWNFGIRQLESEFTYISTAGDTITREGIRHLVETARRLRCDVLASPPELVPEPGVPPPDNLWPVHEICAELQLRAPAILRRSRVYHYALIYAMTERFQGLLGSSASNLYRAAMLRDRPFPEDCGHVGDVFWGLRHALDVSFAITPRGCSTFLIHPSNPSAKQREAMDQIRARAPGVARDTLEAALPRPDLGDAEELDWLRRYHDAGQHFLIERERLNGFRREHVLWAFRPSAWRIRAERNRQHRRMREADQRLRQYPALVASTADPLESPAAPASAPVPVQP